MNKIFVWCEQAGGYWEGNVVGYAMAEDGTHLASHMSSNESWSKHDMGLTSTWKHEEYYKAHYPDGYELEWVDDKENHRAFRDALALSSF